jgi:hypothetical protein
MPEDKDAMEEELANFKPEGLTVERMQELNEQKDLLTNLARDGQFGFQILMMHPTGHVQMATDINNLVQFWLDNNDLERITDAPEVVGE